MERQNLKEIVRICKKKRLPYKVIIKFADIYTSYKIYEIIAIYYIKIDALKSTCEKYGIQYRICFNKKINNKVCIIRNKRDISVYTYTNHRKINAKRYTNIDEAIKDVLTRICPPDMSIKQLISFCYSYIDAI